MATETDDANELASANRLALKRIRECRLIYLIRAADELGCAQNREMNGLRRRKRRQAQTPAIGGEVRSDRKRRPTKLSLGLLSEPRDEEEEEEEEEEESTGCELLGGKKGGTRFCAPERQSWR
ncbi:hypothetical protein ACJRO7_006433 [Eucalyptus globulus]|uniref:Uncharacterized protein n=1 Tax=Eucalyptus globulus TaxID=34317 RepID=A0ABD3IKG5_EUCGL